MVISLQYIEWYLGVCLYLFKIGLWLHHYNREWYLGVFLDSFQKVGHTKRIFNPWASWKRKIIKPLNIYIYLYWYITHWCSCWEKKRGGIAQPPPTNICIHIHTFRYENAHKASNLICLPTECRFTACILWGELCLLL